MSGSILLNFHEWRWHYRPWWKTPTQKDRRWDGSPWNVINFRDWTVSVLLSCIFRARSRNRAWLIQLYSSKRNRHMYRSRVWCLWTKHLWDLYFTRKKANLRGGITSISTWYSLLEQKLYIYKRHPVSYSHFLKRYGQLIAAATGLEARSSLAPQCIFTLPASYKIIPLLLLQPWEGSCVIQTVVRPVYSIHWKDIITLAVGIQKMDGEEPQGCLELLLLLLFLYFPSTTVLFHAQTIPDMLLLFQT